LEQVRQNIARRGIPADSLSAEDLKGVVKMMQEGFRTSAPLSAAGAATVILDGVRAGKWRILVGDDAHRLDEAVRANPEGAYDHESGIGMSTLDLA
jgi:hypothetical protein